MGGVMLDYLVDDSLGESIRHQLGLKFCRNPQPQSASQSLEHCTATKMSLAKKEGGLAAVHPGPNVWVKDEYFFRV
jgi:hypothetical protein